MLAQSCGEACFNTFFEKNDYGEKVGIVFILRLLSPRNSDYPWAKFTSRTIHVAWLLNMSDDADEEMTFSVLYGLNSDQIKIAAMYLIIQ